MRLLMIPLVAGGLTMAACSDDSRTDNVAVADNGVAIVADADGTMDGNMAMGNAATAVASAESNRVFFALDSAELSDAARQQLDRIASEYRETPGVGVTLAGFTDTTGTRPYNQELSEQRANTVRSYLVERGVAAGEIDTEARGQNGQRVDTADNVAEPANRRVRIEFGDQS
ncbi:OmpA family protein [Sphingomonas suaedae]|uniref:OmpA family protein n=1 Tax=Sphingomonas suaedae TaxID=2599297 RepID=A0A518RFC9_9SPHN|nr:OmpA family protein [Sphingomonas suaedae]QDX26133.1 OmpA family protein [Sphingomonas suaedae]